MQYRTLICTGVQFGSLVLGAMNFGQLGRSHPGRGHRHRQCRTGGGISRFDTADMYSQGESGKVGGKAIAGRINRELAERKIFL